VSAFAVSIQAQIIYLLDVLKRELGLIYVFISHDVSVIGYVSDRLAVMYLGEIVEIGAVRILLETPRHPYTQALPSAVPRMDEDAKADRIRVTGDLPSPINPPSGCKFHTRCPMAQEICRQTQPAHKLMADGVRVACHLIE
jgi:oligopeptide/dipeptide ABC transporter ATP-binding protein